MPALPVSTPTSAPSHSNSLAKRAPQQLSVGGFDEHNENLHGVEFEAPFSSESQNPPFSKSRFSIDFSIELERQLDSMEASSPTSPPTHGSMNVDANKRVLNDHSTTDADVLANGHHDKELLDPAVLAHIVTQLRQSLSEITKERDELVKMLTHANAEEANVKDALQLMTEKATEAEEELGEARRRMKEDEEQIVLLRAKVEESRRGLMRLQTESRRQSMTPIDIGRASSLTLASYGNPPSAKRASFTPLTGSRHGRIPSVSDNNSTSPERTSTHASFGEPGLSPNHPSSSRRFSGLFGRVSPGIPDNEADTVVVIQSPPNTPEIETLKAQVNSLKGELESVKHELTEANEAKEASEMCVKALREFIAENNIGAVDAKLPLPPGGQDGADVVVATEPKKTGSGWGFKLWGSGSGGSSSSGVSMVNDGGTSDLHHGIAIPPPMSAAPSGDPPTSVSSPTPSVQSAPAPLSRKLTGLFSSRSSSSRGSSAQTNSKSQLGSCSTAASSPLIDRTNSTYSYSDVSSVVELMSPVLGDGDVVKGVRNLDLVGEIQKGQETPAISLHEVDLDGGLR